MTPYEGQERRAGNEDLHRKMDRIILLLEDERVGLCPRLKNVENTVYGSKSGNLPGLSEQMREQRKKVAYTGLLLLAGYEFAKEFILQKFVK